MILDALLLLSDAQALTASAPSTNVIDMGVNGQNYGDGAALAVVISTKVAADFTSADETYSVKMQMDDNAAFSSPTDVGNVYTYIASTRAIGGFVVLILPIGVSMERYFRLQYTLGGTTPSITVIANLLPTDQVPFYRTYADNSLITG